MKILKKSYHLINPVPNRHKPENQNAPMCEKHPFLVRFFRSNFIHNRTPPNPRRGGVSPPVFRQKIHIPMPNRRGGVSPPVRYDTFISKNTNPENPEILKILVQTKNAFVVAQFIAPLILHSVGATFNMETKASERRKVYSCRVSTNK